MGKKTAHWNIIEQSDLLGLWHCLHVMLHAKKMLQAMYEGKGKGVGSEADAPFSFS